MGNTSNFDNENQKKIGKSKKKRKTFSLRVVSLKEMSTAYSKSLKIILRYYIETSNDKNQITEYLKIKKIREVGKIWCCDKRLKKKKEKTNHDINVVPLMN